MAFILKNIAMKKPGYFAGLQSCGLPVLRSERRRARIYNDFREAERVADMLNRYTQSAGELAEDENIYIIEDL